MQKQLPLTDFRLSNYLLYSEQNNITADGLRLMPDCKLNQLKNLRLGNNIFIKSKTILAAGV
jgi:hypothetical protein